MHARQIALAAARCLEPAQRPHGQELGVQLAGLQLAEQIIESHAVTSHHDQVSHLQRGGQ